MNRAEKLISYLLDERGDYLPPTQGSSKELYGVKTVPVRKQAAQQPRPTKPGAPRQLRPNDPAYQMPLKEPVSQPPAV